MYANANDVQVAYDQWHAAIDEEDDATSPWHQLVKQFLDRQRDVAGKQVLEIACGRGGFSCWLKEWGDPAELVAADFSGTALDRAKSLAAKRALEGIRWEQADIENIHYADNYFDTVLSCETIEHVPDPVRAIAELARVLRPGGFLYLTTPNYFSLTGVYRFYCGLRGRVFTEVGQPLNNLVLIRRTARWVRESGLRIHAIDGMGHWIPIPRTHGIKLKFLDRARWLTRWFACHSLVVGTKP